jgi:predicted nucleotidyltransferase component of viral defense system
MLVDLDYAIGWALSALFGHPDPLRNLAFRGGTCLSKCYIHAYRFSEDLDFTALGELDDAELRREVIERLEAAAEVSGIDFFVEPPSTSIVFDGIGSETLEMRFYFRATLDYGGSPRAIRLDITLDEDLYLSPDLRSISHPYSDAGQLGHVEIPCYRLEEVMAEKLRALLDQRIYAVSRDIYDVSRLLGQRVHRNTVLDILPRKFWSKGLTLDRTSVVRLRDRKAEYASDWQRNLLRLLPATESPDFETAWQAVTAFLATVAPGSA